MNEITLQPVATSFKGGTLAADQGFLLRFERPLADGDWELVLEALDDMFLDLIEDAAYGEAAPDLVYVIRDDMADAAGAELADIAALVGTTAGIGCTALKIVAVAGDTATATVCR